MQKETKSILENAMEYTGDNPPEHTRANIYIISDKCDSDFKRFLIDLIYGELSTAKQDIAYQIANDAINFLLDNDDWENIDDTMLEEASVYTAERLEYLNQNNEAEITDILKEYECDIQTACAIWYDQQVTTAVYAIIEYFKS